MKESQLVLTLKTLIEDAKTAILITQTGDFPDARWMTPVLLDSRPLSIFCVTSRNFVKTDQVIRDTRSTWMFQSRLLDKIAKIKGFTRVIDDETLLDNVLSALSSRLDIFWRINKEETDIVLLETKISKADFFYPLKAEHQLYSFQEGSIEKN